MKKIGALFIVLVFLGMLLTTLNALNESLIYRQRYLDTQIKYVRLLVNHTVLQNEYFVTLGEYGLLQNKYIMLAEKHLRFIDNLTAVLGDA